MTRLFQEKDVDSPRLSAEVLLAKALGLQRHELLKMLTLNPEAPLAPERIAEAWRYARRRAAGEPAAYILGEKEFYGRAFALTPAVLIPRPETELLIDLALDEARQISASRNSSPPVFADFGTGSGCIAATLSLELPSWQGVALEKSPAALAVARKNAHRLGAHALAFVLGDFTVPPLAPGSLDLLLSNPPYVSEEEYHALSPEVRGFEPKTALVPGAATTEKARGPEDLLSILDAAQWLLKPGGKLLMEIGHAQGPFLLRQAKVTLWRRASIHKDLAGLDRVLFVEKPPQCGKHT